MSKTTVYMKGQDAEIDAAWAEIDNVVQEALAAKKAAEREVAEKLDPLVDALLARRKVAWETIERRLAALNAYPPDFHDKDKNFCTSLQDEFGVITVELHDPKADGKSFGEAIAKALRNLK